MLLQWQCHNVTMSQCHNDIVIQFVLSLAIDAVSAITSYILV